MGIFSNLSAKKEPVESKQSAHAVIASFSYGSIDMQRLFEVEGRLESAIF